VKWETQPQAKQCSPQPKEIILGIVPNKRKKKKRRKKEGEEGKGEAKLQ